MPKDVYNEVTFILGLKKTNKGVTTSGVWNKLGPASPSSDERFVQVTLEIPESLWAHPKMKGRMESKLEEDFEGWIKDLKAPSMGQEDLHD